MELPQPRAYVTEGRKTTLDFLSLWQDPRPGQGGFLRTHDFLQPLERAGKTVGKEEIEVEMTTNAEKPHPPSSPAVEHTLPGGIGTYTISYLHTVARPSSSHGNDENSNSTSRPRSGFNVWNESTLKTDNIAGERAVLRETGLNRAAQLATSMGRPSQTPSNLKNKTATFFSSSQPFSDQNRQSFLNMIASKSMPDEDEEFVIKKEQSLNPKDNLSVKDDGKSGDQKPNNPRSKHSETEQRRRSKINDRFQMLRGIIPHSDQKRDKASFLLEVIEHIQFLQEKVHKFEGSNEPSKLPWSKCQRGAQENIDHSHGTNNVSGPAMMFAAEFSETRPGSSMVIPISEQKIEPNTSIASPKQNGHQCDDNDKPVSIPIHPNVFPFRGTSNTVEQHSPQPVSKSQSQSQCVLDRSPTTGHAVSSNKLKEEDLTIDSGTISISSTYSQGLLNTLTKALENCGVDLSQASISVHVDVGKRSNNRLDYSASTLLKAFNSTGDDVSTIDQPHKRLKTGSG